MGLSASPGAWSDPGVGTEASTPRAHFSTGRWSLAQPFYGEGFESPEGVPLASGAPPSLHLRGPRKGRRVLVAT